MEEKKSLVLLQIEILGSSLVFKFDDPHEAEELAEKIVNHSIYPITADILITDIGFGVGHYEHE